MKLAELTCMTLASAAVAAWAFPAAAAPCPGPGDFLREADRIVETLASAKLRTMEGAPTVVRLEGRGSAEIRLLEGGEAVHVVKASRVARSFVLVSAVVQCEPSTGRFHAYLSTSFASDRMAGGSSEAGWVDEMMNEWLSRKRKGSL
jgi:hypothetical protein